MLRRLILLMALLVAAPLLAKVPANPPKDWTTSIEPFRIADNLYYVGSQDLASYLITTPAGNILINANLQNSPPQIKKSIEQLGFRWSDTRILLSSQAHYDHMAGAAQIVHETGARLEVMQGDADVIESGGRTSFDLPNDRYPAARVSHVLHDGETITLGGRSLTALRTAGHTRGCTTFTLPVKQNGAILTTAIVCGLGNNPGVRLTATQDRPASYPGIVNDWRHTFAVYRSLPVDIFLGAHGAYFDLLQKLDRGARTHPELWVDREGYRQAVEQAEQAFLRKLKQQRQ